MMIVMPISSYPMPSDKNSQAQVLQEQKSELTEQAQAVEQSHMDRRSKARVVGGIDEKISQTSQDMAHDYAEYSFEQHRKEEILQKERMEAADAQQIRLDSESQKDAEKRSLDVTA